MTSIDEIQAKVAGPATPWTASAHPVAEARRKSVKAHMKQAEDGSVTVKDVPLYQPILVESDHANLLLQFGFSPEHFEVVPGSVSSWMQSASDGQGGRDLTYLYSAKFRPIAGVSGDLSNREQIDRWRTVFTKTPNRTAKPRLSKKKGKPGTYAAFIADPQLGKPGTAIAVQNWREGLTGHLEECQRLIDSGKPVEGVHLALMGDETEGVCNNYTNQSHVIELNQAEQEELHFDLLAWSVKEAAKIGLPLSASAVISNHGETTRNGGKDPVTSHYDNTSTKIARLVAKYFRDWEKVGAPKITWTFAETTPGIVVDLSGEQVYLSHGYVEKGTGRGDVARAKSLIERQLNGDRLAERRLQAVRLWVLAHYHHAYQTSFEGSTVFGCPALEAEGSSEYMKAQFGVWSPSGMLGMLVGHDEVRGWSNASIFGGGAGAVLAPERPALRLAG